MMPEKKRAPHQSGRGKGNVSQIQGHLCDKTADELLTELEARMDEMTDLTYDEDVIDSYLAALDKKLLSKKILMWNGHGKSSVHSMRFYSTRTFCPNRRFPKEDLMDSVSAEPSQELSLLRPSSPYSLCFVRRPLASTCLVQSGDGRRRHSALLPRQALQLPRFPQFPLTLMGF